VLMMQDRPYRLGKIGMFEVYEQYTSNSYEILGSVTSKKLNFCGPCTSGTLECSALMAAMAHQRLKIGHRAKSRHGPLTTLLLGSQDNL
jgi:hypothetical protein